MDLLARTLSHDGLKLLLALLVLTFPIVAACSEISSSGSGRGAVACMLPSTMRKYFTAARKMKIVTAIVLHRFTFWLVLLVELIMVHKASSQILEIPNFKHFYWNFFF